MCGGWGEERFDPMTSGFLKSLFADMDLGTFCPGGVAGVEKNVWPTKIGRVSMKCLGLNFRFEC